MPKNLAIKISFMQLYLEELFMSIILELEKVNQVSL